MGAVPALGGIWEIVSGRRLAVGRPPGRSGAVRGCCADTPRTWGEGLAGAGRPARQLRTVSGMPTTIPLVSENPQVSSHLSRVGGLGYHARESFAGIARQAEPGVAALHKRQEPWRAPAAQPGIAGCGIDAARRRLATGGQQRGRSSPSDLPRAFRTADLRLIHAAICCSRYSSWTCCGVRY
jgi:hypothetical protein